ncbi:uncharacterized protein LOC118736208 [Rhagoletis pomonella]|uniref:uncharacterized protein LOC118736208 n=1 Tax=Rhagoletis pomonella TaxID=28610 RepID=UPI0017819954|nr:uncharacterized protein LOC118736208 [Rhagoletis pomonella]
MTVKLRDAALKTIKRYLAVSINEANGFSSSKIEGYVKLLEEQWAKFTEAQDAVEVSCGVETIDAEEQARVQAEAWYVEALCNFKQVLSQTSLPIASTPTAVTQAIETSTTAVRLPRIELSKFCGDSTGWILFHDSFKALVHDNTTLSGYQKLHYLRSCLQGEALQVVSNLTISEANYHVAWDLICSKYKVMRIIVDSHFRAIFNIKPVTNETAQTLKHVLNSMLQNIRALQALERPVEAWDDWWELSFTNDKLPTFNDLQTFLESRCRSLEVLAPGSGGPTSKRGSNAAVLHADHKASNCKSTSNCLRCGRRHHTLLHESYNNTNSPCETSAAAADTASCAAPAPNRVSSEKHTHLATSSLGPVNALYRSHDSVLAALPTSALASSQRAAELTTPAGKRESNGADINCNSAPAAPLPITEFPPCGTSAFLSPAKDQAPNRDVQQATVWSQGGNMTSHYAEADNAILLATAVANVRDYVGRWHAMRILFDSGSHASFVTERCVQQLRLPRRSSAILITGIGSTPSGRPRGEITSDLPTTCVSVADWQHIKGLTLADPHFATPAPIDILIGMDEMEHFLTTDLRKGPPGTPLAQRTALGWVLFGRTRNPTTTTHAEVPSLHCDVDLVKILSKVWELDQVPHRQHLTNEEKFCEDLFDSTHQRAADGRFIVQLPLKPSVPIGETRSVALRSFYRLEKRLAANEHLRRHYVEFMHELLRLGHMECVRDRPSSCYYMPHHAVLKETSETTKLRVVFNASMKSSSGFSLNDALMVGPPLQQELFPILLRFRMHRYAMTADIAKMYRQVYVHEKHVDFQRIVWRDAPTEELKDYRILRLTYGTAAASHLAVKALQHNRAEFQSSAEIILRDFYMDDLLTGAHTADELVLRQSEVSHLLLEGGFELRKWASNCKQLLDKIPTSTTPINHLLAENGEVKTLGLTWNTSHDYLTYAVSLKTPPTILTKRGFLSDASTTFDPLGLIAPCTIKARIWFQQIWRTDVDWDEPVSDQIAKDWYLHRDELRLLSNLKLNRWLGMSPNAHTEFHVFADASEKAYAAVAYARTKYLDGKIVVNLVASRSKVAPLKTTTLPRLELCAAHLGAKLIKQITACVCSPESRMFGWTDSTVTLAWLQSHPSRWSTFVANRVAEVQEILPSECWAHVRSESNPAYCASRGMSPSSLLSHKLWWHGPSWLSSSSYVRHEVKRQDHITQLELRKKTAAVNVAEPSQQWTLLEKCSSFSKLKRVTAYVMRFIDNVRSCAQTMPRKQTGPLTSKEIQVAELKLIRGFCKVMFSDNGTNFVGAEKHLRNSLQQCMTDDRFRSFFSDLNIDWRFNPPAAPHMGGYWEIGIKRVKYHLKRTLGDTLLSYEEFNTLLTEIEACVNSRPLCDNSTNVSDLEVVQRWRYVGFISASAHMG